MVGGTEMIRLLVPDLPPVSALAPYLREIDTTHYYTNFGPLSRRLESKLAQLTGARHVVCLSSCTTGLELTLSALELPPGSKIALPSFTFAATGTAILRTGHEPIFCDIDPETYLLTPDTVAVATAKHDIVAVMPVCLFGRGYDSAQWDGFSRQTGIPVILDAAGAIAHQSPGVTTAAVFSLHATKPLSAGEGGFLATSDAGLAAKVRLLSNFGFGDNGVEFAGANGKMSEYHAAACLAGLDAWPQQKAKREKLFQTYVRSFEKSGAARHAVIVNGPGLTSGLAVRLERDLLARDLENLAAAGIETRRWYWPPLHRHKVFASCPRASPLDVTEAVVDRLLGLPYHLFLTRLDIARIARAIAGLSR